LFAVLKMPTLGSAPVTPKSLPLSFGPPWVKSILPEAPATETALVLEELT
jgi:hypothetical protein